MKYLLIICLFLLGCATPEKAVVHESAVPVEKIVYRPLSPELFLGCPENPEPLKAGITVMELLNNRYQWKLIALCEKNQLQAIHDLK